MNNLNKYTSMLDTFYRSGTNNHENHNANPEYYSILLKHIIDNQKIWINKSALDYGCGKGRNVSNLLNLSNWKNVDGVDISNENIIQCKNNFDPLKSTFIKNNGSDISDIANDSYDFIMSTIVLQHLCVHELRYKIKSEIFRVLKSEGIFSFQMGCDLINKNTKNYDYYANNYAAMSSNGENDVEITKVETLIEDLIKIGFKNITYTISKSWDDDQHPQWIYVSCSK